MIGKFGGSLLLLIAVAALTSADSEPQPWGEDLLAGLKAPDFDGLGWDYKAADQQIRFLKAAMEMAAGADRDQVMKPRFRAVAGAIGQLRAPQGVEWCLDRIKVTVPPVVGGLHRPQDKATRPCVKALVEIGLPALGPLCDRVASVHDAELTRLAADVIVQVFGSERLSDEFVAERIDAAKSDSEKNQLWDLRRMVTE